jgi:hypothetical protein
MSEQQDLRAIAAALAAPFEASEVKWRAGPVSADKSSAKPLAYIDARCVMDRLDSVLGMTGWKDEYEVLPDGTAVCRLSLRLGGEWLTKMDVGPPSQQPAEGDKRKAAFSNALRRAAVKFGIGRYLYRVDAAWVPYDAQKNRLVQTPALPPFALPAKKAAQPVAPKPASGKLPDRPPEPYHDRMDPAELIDRHLWDYLVWLAKAKGITRRQIKDSFGVKKLADLTVAQYRQAIARLNKYQDVVPA